MQGFRIVGIGASAGGLESLEQLFSALPADAGMAYFVVQHLSPDFRSVMDELIGRRSNMPVHVVEDGVVVEPNHIYLLPPRKEMVLRGRRLLLTDKPHGLSLPIAMFFRSLAQDVGGDAIAVVLSGSGSDGSRGIIDVKRAGGTVMIESPATAKFDGMPLSARATGTVDHVATPGDLGRILCGLPPLEPVSDDLEVLSADPAMDSLLRLLTRETLQATIEELETSNEEMQATNEELVAANEELQSTNEELHSVNEELYTVNAEYQQKIVELKQLNADIEHLLEGTDVGTLFLDHDLCIRRFTSRMATVFHLQPHDIGRKLGDFSHNIERAALMAEIERVLETGATIEDEVRDRVGRPFFLRILPYRVSRDTRDAELPRIEGVVLTLTDLSVLAVARAHVAQLSAIVESSDDAIIGLALDDTTRTWNRAAEQLYGYSAVEIVGKSLRTLLPTEDQASLDAQFDALRRGERIDRVHAVHVRKDGARIDVAVTLSPIEDRAHELVGISAIARDIGPTLDTQRELEQRSDEIRALLDSTAEAARRREQFLAMLSHELRNPLAAVLNATRLISDAPAPAVHERCIAVLDRQARHMARLLDDLLDVSRITRGKLHLHAADLDLREPIEAAIEATSPLFDERRIELEVILPQVPAPVHGDASRLQQVAANLLSNAANYSPTGSRVELRLSLDRDQITLRVTDRGIGIAPDILGRIFELFVQAEQHLDRPRGGLGVGLSLARGIVELHGGTIEAASRGVNRGAELTVRLPLAAAADPKDELPRRLTSRRRIVLVEDQHDAREMLRMLLESRDHEVLDTGDGASAVELIARARPDVALIDIGLPTMNGYEVAQRVRERSDLQHVRLVALTGYGAPGDVAAARDAGFDAHLVKPVDLSRIEELLDRFTSTISSPDRT